MKITFFIHGTPRGADSWGENVGTESSYLSSFYDSSGEDRLFVTLRQAGGKLYSYYHYLIYNCIDSDDRSGGYFAISVKIDDCLCKNVKDFYNIFRTLFFEDVQDCILQSINGKQKYLIARFSLIENRLTDIRQHFERLFKQKMNGNDFVALNAFSGNAKENIQRISLDDCSSEQMLQLFKTYTSVAISHKYRKIKEQVEWNELKNQIQRIKTDCSKQLGAAKNAGEKEKAALQSEKETLLKKLSSSENDKEKSVKKIDLLNDEIKRIKQENAALKQGKTVSEVLEPVMPQVEKLIVTLKEFSAHSGLQALNEELSRIMPQNASPSSYRKSTWWQKKPKHMIGIGIIVLIVGFALGLGVGYLCWNCEPDNDRNIAHCSSIPSVEMK